MNECNAYAWAWEFKGISDGKWHLCHWAEPSKEKLLLGDKPSPEARPVRVKLVPTSTKARMRLGFAKTSRTE